MKFLSSVLKLSGFAAVFALAGCDIPPAKGGVQFQYVLIVDDGVGGAIAALDCATAGVAKVKLNLGLDANADGVLDAAENVTQLEAACNQADADNSGTLEAAEFGTFDSGLVIDPQTFDAISVEFLDAANANINWEPTAGGSPAQIFTFVGDTTIEDQKTLVLPFVGDPATQVADELQVFLNGL